MYLIGIYFYNNIYPLRSCSWSLQVNPHTHQVKLCDFGSAKMLVCLYYTAGKSFLLILLGLSWIFNYRFQVSPTFHTYVPDIIGLRNWSLELLSIQLQLICGSVGCVMAELLLGQVCLAILNFIPYPLLDFALSSVFVSLSSSPCVFLLIKLVWT